MGRSGSPWITAQLSSVADGISRTRRISSRGQFGADGVNRVFGPRMQRTHRRGVRGCTFQRPWGIIRVQKWTNSVRCRGEAGCTRTAIEGTVGSHRHFHRTVSASRSLRTRSRNGASEFSVAETGTVARADHRRDRCRCTSSPIRFGGRIGKVEGQGRPVGSQSQHKSSSGSCRSCEDQGRQAQGALVAKTTQFPTMYKIWTSGLGQRCWSCAGRKRCGRFGVSHTFDKFHFAGHITHEDEAVQPSVLSNSPPQPRVGRQSSSREASFDVGLSWRECRGSVEPRPCSHPPGQEVGVVAN